MPETRYALFVLGVGAGFFIAMYEWVTMIAEAMPCGYCDAWVTHEPRWSRIGPSLTFATIAAPSRSAANVNATKSRHMPPSLFRIQRLSISHPHDCPRLKVRDQRKAVRRGGGG
jgi:hypothetical protein